MIRWFFYAAVSFVVCVLSRTCCLVLKKYTDKLLVAILFLLLAVAALAGFVSVFVFLFIGFFKVLSNFNCW